MKKYFSTPLTRLIQFGCLAVVGLLPARSWAQVLPPACASPVPAPANSHGNLIYNGSFEEGDTSVVPLGLPTGLSGICNRISSGGYLQTRAELAGWGTATQGTPDWFKTGAMFAVGVPNNHLSYNTPVLPHSGDSYAGFMGNSDIPEPDTTLYYREYLMQRLGAALQNGQEYYVAFYSRLAGRSAFADHALGFKAFAGDPYQPHRSFLRQPDSTSISPDIFRHDTAFNSLHTWSRTAGVFRAIGGEDHIVFGNFRDSLPAYQTNGPFSGSSFDSYQFIDDVLLQPFPDPLLTYDPATSQLLADVIGALPPSSGAEYEWEWDEPCPAPCTPQHHSVRSTDPAFLPPTPYAASYTLTVHVPYPDGSGYYRGTTHPVPTPRITGLAHATPDAAVTIYPNPTPDGRFTLEAPSGATLTLTDALGREVWRTSHL